MRLKIILGVAALLVGSGVLPARAQVTPATLTVTPASGPVGTEFVVTGDECLPEGPGNGLVSGEWVLSTLGGDGLAAGGSLADESGVWQDGFPSEPELGPIPGPGYYVVEAQCVDESSAVLFTYEPAILLVTPLPGTLSVTPTAGPEGTTFTVSGDQCTLGPDIPDGAGPVSGTVGNWYVSLPSGGDPLTGGAAIPDADGAWSGSLATGPRAGTLPGPGSYLVTADCVDWAGAVLYRYEPVTITVTAAAVPSEPAFTG